MVERYEVTSRTKLSQMFDMTFDLSAFDMFVAWERRRLRLLSIAKELQADSFIRNNNVTIVVFGSVHRSFMKQLGLLKPGHYPQFGLACFCGEPLPVTSVQAWCDAAPNSIVENLYGQRSLRLPALLSLGCPTSAAKSEMGIVPIGYPYPGMKYLVVDEDCVRFLQESRANF